MKKIFLILLILVAGSKLYAQCPNNIGFELNNLIGWKSFIDTTSNCNSAALSCVGASGSCYGNPGLAALTMQVCNYLGPNRQINNTNTSRHNTIKVINSTGTVNNPGPTDPYSGLPLICPGSGNNYSLQLGNAERGAHAERVQTQFVVTSSNSSLIYRFAAVLEDISFTSHHSRQDRPRLDFAVYDLGTTTNIQPAVKIPCASFIQWLPTLDTLAANPQNYPGWFAGVSNTVCSNWIPVAVNLSRLLGHIIIIEFTTADCAQTGHFGYAYIDIPNGCKPFTITTGFCSGQDTAFLHGPVGFGSYNWFDKSTTPPTFINSGKDIIFKVPSGSLNIPIACVVTPGAGVGCNDTLIDTLRQLPDPSAGFTFNQNICAGSPVQFIDTSKTNVNGSNIIHWQWDFDGDKVDDDTVHQNPFHTFSSTGTYTIRLIVKSDLSCVSDTAFGQIVNVSLPAVYPNAGNDTSICQGSVVQLNGSTYPGYTYQWYTLNGVAAPLNGLSNDTISNPTASPTTTTTYYYRITDTVHQCFFIDSITISINGVSPAVYIKSLLDTICPQSTTVLDIANISFNCGITQRFCSGTPTNTAIGTGSANVSTYPTVFPGAFSDGKTQMIYLASELTATGFQAGQIEGLTFYVTSKNSTAPYRNLTIKLGCTNLNTYGGSGAFITTTSMVATIPIYNTVAGANYIPFQRNYVWDGVSNLVVEVCYDNVVSTATDPVMQSTTPLSSVKYNFSSSSGTSGCTLTSGSTSSLRPNITFKTCVPSFGTATYLWTPASAIQGPANIKTPIAKPAITTTYTCLINDGNGCTALVSKVIEIDATTSINAGKDTTICNGQIYLAQNTVSGVAPYNWQWTSNPIGLNSSLVAPSLSPSATTTYFVSFHGYHNCIVKDTIVVKVNPIPTSNFTVTPNPVCSGDNATVTYNGNAPVNATYTWNFNGGTIISGSGQGPYQINWPIPGTKSVTLVVTSNGCSSSITTHQVVVNLSPTATFTVNPSTICTGAANLATVTYTGNAYATSQYNWNFAGGTVTAGSGKGPLSVYWNNYGNLNVSLTVTEGGCTSTQIVPIVVNQSPISNFTVSPTSACTGDNLTVTYTGNMACPNTAAVPFNWNFASATATPGGTSCGPQSIVFTNGGVFNISLSINNNGCISPVTTVPITITQTPSSNFSIAPNAICANSPTQIFYNGTSGANAGYNWSVSGSTNPVHITGNGPFNISWTENGNSVVNEVVSLIVTENGCTSTKTTNLVAVTPIPTSDFTVTSPVCAGGLANVNYIGVNNIVGANYNWNWGSAVVSSGSGVGPYQVLWPSSGTQSITLVVNQNGCFATPFTVPVNVLSNPIVTAHPDTSICPNTPVSLWSQGANSYYWPVDGSVMPGTTVTPTGPLTTYQVTGTDNSGCTGVGTVVVKWRILPYINAGFDTIINRGNNVHIGDTNNIKYNIYNWTSNNNTPVTNPTAYFTTASPTASTLFIINVVDTIGCTNSDTVNVIVQGCTQLEVPNAFNPSSAQEANKTFRAANSKALLSLSRFEIYNRWGVKVFSTKDKTAAWDGKYNGSDQEMGSYTYYIEGICEDGYSVHKEGNVTLVR